MYAFITILIVIVCILLGAVVLIQNPKGGGLSSSFGGVGQQLLGARRSTDLIEKLTWGFAFALIFLSLTSAFFVDKTAVVKKDDQPKSVIEENMKTNPGTFGVGAGGVTPVAPAQGGGAAQPGQTPPPPGQ
ncbi:MAG TPA: preprotein translocase subunit SecG [Chitinophagales bacterium]|nr:preprotein translocase subunit SecG [Chitinophagales bacterium]